MDDVILTHKPRQLNVAAQLMEAQPTCSLGLSNNNNNNNNSHDNVYGAVIMTKVIARVHPVHLMNVIIIIAVATIILYVWPSFSACGIVLVGFKKIIIINRFV